jgi:hypothetical protein
MTGAIKSRPINEWMGVFSELYSEVDSHRTPEQMWIAVMAHTSSIGESIRRYAFESLLDSAAHTFCWMCSFVNICNKQQEGDIFSMKESLCGIVSLKYPMKCGHCLKSTCECDPVKMDKIKDKSALYGKLLEYRTRVLKSFDAFTIDDCLNEFNGIYGGRIHIQTLENIGFHFLEEIGEAAIVVRELGQLRRITDDPKNGIDIAFLKNLTTVEGIVQNYAKYGKHGTRPKKIEYDSKDKNMLKARIVRAKMGLVIELADSFSWFCAILNKLDSITRSIQNHSGKHTQSNLKALEQVLHSKYFGSDGKAKCPSCNHKPCKCVFFSSAP